ncbi:MAG: putative glycolipid-binding domain-containing protein [Chloroflexota bacterium]
MLCEYAQDHSVEYFRLMEGERHYLLKGRVNCLLEGQPTNVNYLIRCTRNLETRDVYIQNNWGNTRKQIAIRVDDEQHWKVNNEPLLFASGLIDIDLGITPATNTLPIRRLSLGINDAQDMTAVWVRFPDLSLQPLPQRYTRLGQNEYAYDSLASGFHAKIHVDPDGVVTSYGDLWQSIS